MVKLNLRTKSIGTRVSEQEYARLERVAQKASKTLAEWCREVLRNSANGGAADTAASARAEALMAEVVALPRNPAKRAVQTVQWRMADGRGDAASH